MSDYQPIIYIWVEVSRLPSTKEQFMLAKYLGGDVRAGADPPVVRCHIWLSDTDIITWREFLLPNLPSLPSASQKYADDVRKRIMEHVALELPILRAQAEKSE